MNSEAYAPRHPGDEHSSAAERSLPPPLPGGTRGVGTSANPPAAHDPLGAFGTDFTPIDSVTTPLAVVDSLLKRPASITYEIMQGSRVRIMGALALIAAVCMLAYGFIMGTFSGGDQLWAVPAKALIGTLLSALICLPSLYIFASVSGARQSFSETCGLLLQSLALSGILMVGFVPIAWIFSQSTGTLVFMGFMHILFWISATMFGLRLLARSLHFLNKRSVSGLTAWGLLFLIVTLQMCTVMRPIIGCYETGWFKEKKFFLVHWSQCIRAAGIQPGSGARK